MKKQLLFLLLCAFFSLSGRAQSISITSVLTNPTAVGSVMTVNYQYTVAADSYIFCGINLLNDWTPISYVAGQGLDLAVAGTNVTGSFNITIPNGTTPTANLTGLQNYKISIELKSLPSYSWIAGDYPATQLNFTAPVATPSISFTSFSTTTEIGTNLTVNYKYTVAAAGQIYCGINLLNDNTYVSFVAGQGLDPAVAGTDVTGTFTILIPNGTTSTADLTGLQNYKINIELRDTSNNFLAGAYPATQINFIVAPLWTGGTSSDWTATSNWSSGVVPNQNSNVLIGLGANQPTLANSTTINSLVIVSGAVLTVTSPNLTVTGSIDNSGTMSLASNSNLIQGGTLNSNTGNIIVNRASNLLSRLDYTIWSSPVANQDLLLFSPATTTNRFYNYNETTNLYNPVPSPSGTPFSVGAGYLIRMPNNAPAAPATMSYPAIFTGVPNSGDISKAVTYLDASHGYNMVGNPYPSTIDANAFIAANSANIETALYFWRKTNTFAGSAYAIYNPLGGTTAAATAPTGEVPNGTIQVGQGFFVKAKSGATAVAFTNAMRLGNSSSQFFKTKQVQKDRLWLNLTSTAGVFSQTLVGYTADASLGVDMYDAKYINDSEVALTSNINSEEFTIQGRPAFDFNDVVALNFKTDVAGDYLIALDRCDGVFATGQDVYLADSKTGSETNLKTTAYNFTAVAGVDNARFSLKYQKTLKVDTVAFSENSVRVYKSNGILHVNSGSVAINTIKVYDVQGRLLASQKNVEATTATINNLRAINQVLIVTIASKDNRVVSKKVLN